MLNKISVFVLILLIINTLQLNSQVKLSGTVKLIDSNLDTIAGSYITIFVEKKSTGTVTDDDGNFSISVSKDIHRISVSSVNTIPLKQDINITKDTFITIYILENVNNLDEIVVTGTMREVSRSQSPIPVEIITPLLFRKNPSPSLIESIGMVNGVKPQINCSVCNTGDIHINGMEGPYTVVLIDGMPIVSALSTVYGLQGIPNSLIDRIEVVKGPASSLYGSEAMGGIINVITKNTSLAPRVSADFFSTSWAEHNIDFGVKFNKHKANGLLGINYFNYSLPKDNNEDGFTDMTLQNRISLFNKWQWSRPGHKSTSIAARYVYEDRWGGQMNWSPKWRGSDSIYGESIYTNRFEVIGSYSLPVKEQIQFQYSYNLHHQNSIYGTLPYLAKQHVGFAQLIWDKKLGDHNALIGISSRYTFYDDNTPGTLSSDGNSNKPDRKPINGFFIQDEINLNKNAILLAGYRYDYDIHHGHIHSPRLAYKYAPDLNTTFRLSMGTGFRVVNLFTEDHAALTGSRQVVIAENLNPERSYNATINIVQKIYSGYNFTGLDFSAFYSYFTNKINGDFDSDPDKIIYSNLDGHAVSAGLALNTDFTISDKIKINKGITYMKVYQVERDRRSIQLYAPAWSGNFTASYMPGKKWAIDLTGQWNGPMRLPIQPKDFRPEYSPFYTLLNLQITKKYKKNIEVYSGIKNLLNFTPKNPLMRPFDPFDKMANDPVSNPLGYTFDTSYNYAPMQGIRGFLGLRITVF